MAPPRQFTPVTAEILRQLEGIAGPAHVFTDRERRNDYGHDETEDLVFLPEAVVEPDTAEQVSAILRLANERQIPVTPRGAGTGLSGGALPVHGGILLSMKRFNRIVEIDRQNIMAVVEPGVVTETFQNAVEEAGLFYPPDPASRGSCHLGGNLAECSGGPRAVKYGVTKDYVLGLEAVLPNGELLRTGGKLLKNVTGYNLTQLIVGSEGTLAVITRIIFRLIPLPRCRETLLAAYDSPEAACKTVPALFLGGIVPSACEFMERDAVESACRHLEKTVPNRDAAAHLLVEVDGSEPSQVRAQAERAGEIMLEGGAKDVVLADGASRQKELWAIRRAVGEAVKSRAVYKEEDTVVPRAALPRLLSGVKEICARHGVTSVCYGHAGDGNLHVNLLKEGISDRDWEDRLPVCIEEIFRHTTALGGTISGEHGIGLVQKRYLPIAFSPAELAILRSVKQAFDPNGVLNPGKIFPDT